MVARNSLYFPNLPHYLDSLSLSLSVCLRRRPSVPQSAQPPVSFADIILSQQRELDSHRSVEWFQI